MANIDLTQKEADALIKMEKSKADSDQCTYPALGMSLTVPIISTDKRETFLLDISRKTIELAKVTLQNRARQTIVLIRLDFGGSPHRNPDHEEIDTPHIHIYREGYGDKWAYSLPPVFTNPNDQQTLLRDFMKYCNITDPPNIEWGLFS